MDFHEILMKGKYWMQKLSTKPTWATGDEGRLIYVEDTESIYVGHSADWLELGLPSGFLLRSNFTYNGGSVAYTTKCKPSVYMCKEKKCQWITELTTNAIGTPAASDWYYLYLNYSAITSGKIITNTELIWSNTEPERNDTYMGYYNGDDRCIFAVSTNVGPTNINFFTHSDNYVQLGGGTGGVIIGSADIDTDWTEYNIVDDVPNFVRKVQSYFKLTIPASSSLGTVTCFYRDENDTDPSGRLIVGATKEVSDKTGGGSSVVDIIVDDTQKFDVKLSRSDHDNLYMALNGWYLPTGM